MPEYHVYVRDVTGARAGEIDSFADLSYTLRFNAVGEWSLNSWDNMLIPRGGGIIINRDGVDVFSGPGGALEKLLNSKGRAYAYGGYDDLVYLAGRLAYPVVSGPPYTAATHDVRTGACETVVKQYVNYNAGPGATTARQISGLTIETDLAIGSTVTGRARFAPMLGLLQSLALAGGDLGFRMLNMAFGVYQPADLRTSIIFSEDLGNLLEYRYKESRPKTNYVICGGGGMGTSRTFTESGDSSSIVSWGRIESFRDRRDTTDLTEMRQSVNEELANGASVFVLSFTPANNLPRMQYGTDYHMGDMITVVIEGVSISGIVRGVKVTVDDKGETVMPIISTPGVTTGLLQKTFSKMDGLSSRIDNLEVV